MVRSHDLGETGTHKYKDRPAFIHGIATESCWESSPGLGPGLVRRVTRQQLNAILRAGRINACGPAVAHIQPRADADDDKDEDDAEGDTHLASAR